MARHASPALRRYSAPKGTDFAIAGALPAVILSGTVPQQTALAAAWGGISAVANLQESALPIADTPTLSRARDLFGRVINGHDLGGSTPATVADRIEQSICLTPSPAVVLTEGSVAATFGVGRRVARQTSRILQLRGVMEPRRGGKGKGGLRVCLPGLDQTLDTIRSDIIASNSPAAMEDARQWLQAEIAGQDDPLGRLVRAMLQDAPVQQTRAPCQTQASLPTWSELEEPASRGHRLAAKLRQQIALLPPGETFLGSLASIAEAHDTSLEVAVEAVRILADAQHVVMRRGRGGGVFACEPQAGRALHMINAFIAANAVSPDRCRAVLNRANIGMIDLARARQDARYLDRVERSFQKMQQAPNATVLGQNWYGFIRDIADMSGNGVLHFIARAMAGSILIRRTRSADLPEAAARELFEASRQIHAHLIGGSQDAPNEAQWRCQLALQDYW